MLITKDNLDALRVTFGSQFQAAYEGTEIFADKIATRIDSNNDRNVYGWIAKQLQARPWFGPRIAQNLTEREYILRNRKFEATVSVERDKIEDDNLGMFAGQIMPDLGVAMAKIADKLLANVLANNAPAFDDKNFFAVDHPTFDGTGSTYANLFGSSALDPTNFAAGMAAMHGYTGENKLPLDVKPNLLIIPPQLERAAREIVQASFIVGAHGTNVSAENVMKGWADILVIPELAGQGTTWYLADVSKGIKPFVNQVRSNPEFVSLDNLDDANVFDRDMFLYGARSRGEVGVTLPFLCAKFQAAAL